jgi:hypothetical protein
VFNCAGIFYSVVVLFSAPKSTSSSLVGCVAVVIHFFL